MTRVKICGLTREADVDAAVAAGADALGFVVDVPVDTPREISPARAAELVAAVPPFVTTVLVTMGADPATADLVERVGTDAVQVHGGLAPDDVTELGATVDASVVVALDAEDARNGDGDADAEQPDRVRAYDEVADALLVDSTDDAGGGGTGRTHDWAATADLARELDAPVVLAGGLDPENVAEAVRTVEPYAVDVATGVESSGGVKDHDAVRAFVERATTARRRVEP